MKRLIVNADDFGVTRRVSQGILEGHRKGIITSTSLLGNGAGFEAAVALSRQAPQLGIGIHLNLTEGKPVSKAALIPSLLDRRGLFAHTPVALWFGIFTDRVKPADIERELRAQIEKVLAAGIGPTHLDGHKHVHVVPGVAAVAMRLAGEYGIRGLRCGVEYAKGLGRLLGRNPRASARILKQALKARVVARLARNLAGQLEQAGLVSPSHSLGITQTGFLDAGTLSQILSSLPEGTSELVCHPGYADSDLRKLPTRLLRQREEELEALTRAEIRREVLENGIQLVSYRDLAEETAQNFGAESGRRPDTFREATVSGALRREVSVSPRYRPE